MSDFWSTFLSQDIPTPNDLNEHNSACAAYPIQNRTVLSLKGVDSAKFMQGQFSCDMNKVTHETFTHGACCNAKGRMVANFTIAKQEDDFLLAIDSSLAESLQNHLKKYMVFFKSTLAPSDYVLTGIKGDNAEAILTDVFGGCPAQAFAQYHFSGGLITQLPFDAGYELWLSPELAASKLPSVIERCAVLTHTAWPLNLISHGLPQLTLENLEAQIPQMLNLGLVGGISFSKGCYTGQEIVARMQYLGKMKRHMYRLDVKGTTIQPGDDVYTKDAKSPIGTVINCVTINGSCQALAVLEDKHLDSPLFIGSDLSTSAELLSLPYDPQYDMKSAGS